MDFYKWLFNFLLIFSVFSGPTHVWSMDLRGSTPSKSEGAEIFTKSYQIEEIHKVASLGPKPLPLAKANKEDGKNANLEVLKFRDIHKPMDGIIQREDTNISGLMSSIYLENPEQPFGVEDKWLKLGKIKNRPWHRQCRNHRTRYRSQIR